MQAAPILLVLLAAIQAVLPPPRQASAQERAQPPPRRRARCMEALGPQDREVLAMGQAPCTLQPGLPPAQPQPPTHVALVQGQTHNPLPLPIPTQVDWVQAPPA